MKTERDRDGKLTLGATIRLHREAAGYSIRKLAPLVGIHHANLSRLENDEVEQPSAEVLQRIADVLEIDAGDLLAYIGVKPSTPEPRTYFRRAYGLSEAEAQAIVRELDERFGKRPQQDDE